MRRRLSPAFVAEVNPERIPGDPRSGWDRNMETRAADVLSRVPPPCCETRADGDGCGTKNAFRMRVRPRETQARAATAVIFADYACLVSLFTRH